MLLYLCADLLKMFADDLVTNLMLDRFDFFNVKSRDGIEDIMQFDGVVERDDLFANFFILIEPVNNVVMTVLEVGL